MCVRCGKVPPSGITNRGTNAGKPSATCADCQEKSRKHSRDQYARKGAKRPKKKYNKDKGKGDHPFTTTGKTYRVKKTRRTGVIVPCPCDDPIILQFKDGKRDAFHLREVKKA